MLPIPTSPDYRGHLILTSLQRHWKTNADDSINSFRLHIYDSFSGGDKDLNVREIPMCAFIFHVSTTTCCTFSHVILNVKLTSGERETFYPVSDC